MFSVDFLSWLDYTVRNNCFAFIAKQLKTRQVFCKNISFCVSFVKYCVKILANSTLLRIFTCILIRASLVYYSSARKRSANVSVAFATNEFSSKNSHALLKFCVKILANASRLRIFT